MANEHKEQIRIVQETVTGGLSQVQTAVEEVVRFFLMGRSEAGKTSLTQALKGEELHYNIPTRKMTPSTLRENMRNPNVSA